VRCTSGSRLQHLLRQTADQCVVCERREKSTLEDDEQ